MLGTHSLPSEHRSHVQKIPGKIDHKYAPVLCVARDMELYVSAGDVKIFYCSCYGIVVLFKKMPQLGCVHPLQERFKAIFFCMPLPRGNKRRTENAIDGTKGGESSHLLVITTLWDICWWHLSRRHSLIWVWFGIVVVAGREEDGWTGWDGLQRRRLDLLNMDLMRERGLICDRWIYNLIYIHTTFFYLLSFIWEYFILFL